MNSLDIGVLQNIVEDNYVNTNILSEKYQVSIRTIRYSISRLRTYLEPFECELKYSNKDGYHFSKMDTIKVEIILQEQLNKKVLVTNARQRRLYLTGQIIRSVELNLETEASELYVSPASLMKDAEELVVANEGLVLKRNIVVNKMSNENILRIVTNIIIKESQASYVIGTSNLNFLFSAQQLDLIPLIVEKINQSSLEIPNQIVEFQTKWLILFCIVHFGISLSDDTGIVSQMKSKMRTEDYRIMEKHLKVLGVGCGSKPKILGLDKFVKDLEVYYGYTIENELEILWLERKLESISLQLENEIEFKFSQTKRNIRLYPYSFSISQQLLNNVLGKASYSRDQVAYICDSIQRILFEASYSQTIMFISENDVSVANSYVEWIISKYTKNVNILIETYSEFIKHKSNYSSGIKFIINCTNNPIVSSVETVNVGPALSIDNLTKIDKMLAVENGNYKFFQQFLSQRLLKIFLNETSFESALTNSAKYLEENGYIKNAKEYKRNCLAREKVGTTYIGYQTMISHPLVHQASQNVLFITVLAQPIDIEGNSVQLIINCAFKEEIDFNISRLFELIMKVIEKEESLNLIVGSKSEMELLINLRNAVIKI